MRQGLTTAAHCAVAHQLGARSVRGRKWLRRCQSRGNRRNVTSQIKRLTRIYFRVCVWLPRDDGVRAQCAAGCAAVRAVFHMRGHARVPVPVPAGRAAVHVFELAAAGVARGGGAHVMFRASFGCDLPAVIDHCAGRAAVAQMRGCARRAGEPCSSNRTR